MRRYGLINGDIREAEIDLGRIARYFKLMAKFRPYVDMPEERYFNKERKGYLNFIEEPRPTDGGNLIEVSGLRLDQVRRMMKRLGFKKISSLPKEGRGGTTTHRWVNFKSSTL